MFDWCATMGNFLGIGSSKTISINHEKYKVTHQIGEGGFSFVYKVEQTSSGQHYALKKTLCQSEEQLKGAQTEAETFSKFSHPNILPAIDIEKRRSEKVPGATEYLIVLPLYDHTLQDALEARKLAEAEYSQYFSERYILTSFLELCNGLQQFHKHNPPLSHNDIKPLNVLVSEKRRLVLFDFGSVAPARHMINNRQEALELQEWANTNMTPIYKAPELFDVKSNTVVDERTDIWAMGCTLYAMAYMENPFESDAATGSIQLAVASGNLRFPNESYSTEFRQLISWMLTVDPQQRPFIDEVISRIDKMVAKINAQSPGWPDVFEEISNKVVRNVSKGHSRSPSISKKGHSRSSSKSEKKSHSRNSSVSSKGKSHSRQPSQSSSKGKSGHSRNKSRVEDEDDDLDTLVTKLKMEHYEQQEAEKKKSLRQSGNTIIPEVFIDSASKFDN